MSPGVIQCYNTHAYHMLPSCLFIRLEEMNEHELTKSCHPLMSISYHLKTHDKNHCRYVVVSNLKKHAILTHSHNLWLTNFEEFN